MSRGLALVTMGEEESDANEWDVTAWMCHVAEAPWQVVAPNRRKIAEPSPNRRKNVEPQPGLNHPEHLAKNPYFIHANHEAFPQVISVCCLAHTKSDDHMHRARTSARTDHEAKKKSASYSIKYTVSSICSTCRYE